MANETDSADLARMSLSRQTLAAYERAGGDATRDPHMIFDEIGILEALVEKYPAKSETLTALIARWRALVRLH